MSPSAHDPRISAPHPRIRYNTIGGVNGPLVILENVSLFFDRSSMDGDKEVPGTRATADGVVRSNSLDTMRLSH